MIFFKENAAGIPVASSTTRRCVGMVDKMDLESIVARRASSSLATDTKKVVSP